MVQAKVRLAARLKVLYLQRINHKKYPKQPARTAKKHVSFSEKTQICRYDPEVSSAPVSSFYR